MTGRGQALARQHQFAQINNGGLASALVLEIGKEFLAGRLSRDEFVAGIVAQGQLAHDAANRLATQFIVEYRGIEAPGVTHAEPVYSEYDSGATLGRAVGTLTDLDQLDPGLTVAGYDAAFWRIVEGLAVRQHRAALNGGRQAVEFSAAVNGKRWRRVTDGNPCAFCAMLATRSDYRTEESALRVVGRSTGYGTASYRATGEVRRTGKTRGTRGLGSRYHNACGCTAVEVLGDWEPSPAEQAHHDLYQRAAEQCDAEGIPRNEDNVLARMRELDDGTVVHDAHKPKTQTGGAGGGRRGGQGPSLESGEPDPSDKNAHKEYWRKRREALGIDYGHDADEIRPPEIKTVERLTEQGGQLRHVPTDHTAAHTSTSDYFWTPPGETTEHLVEIKSLEDSTVLHKATFPMRIKKAVGKSMKHGEDKRKKEFVVDAGDRPITPDVRRSLETFNADNPGYEIDRLWLMSNGSTEEIRLT